MPHQITGAALRALYTAFPHTQSYCYTNSVWSLTESTEWSYCDSDIYISILQNISDQVTKQRIKIFYSHQLSGLIWALYNSVICVWASQSETAWFTIETGVLQVCVVVPDSFTTGIDWLLERTIGTGVRVGTGINGVSFGPHLFSDLDFADDVALLVKLLELLVPALETMTSEAASLRLEMNCQKRKVQALVNYCSRAGGCSSWGICISWLPYPLNNSKLFWYLAS